MSLAAPALGLSRPRGEPLPYELAPHGLALAMFALAAFSPAVFNDSDTFLHIAAGDWMLAHHAVPHVDPFTLSFAGKPWTAHEWLSELLLALARRAGGFAGVALLTAVAAGSAMYVVMRRTARDLGGPALAVVGALALMMITPSLLARPHMLALPIMALWADTLFAARSANRAPPIAAALLMTLWANLHGGFAFGLALIAPLAVEAVLAAPRKLEAARAWALFALAAVVAALITPFGLQGLAFPVQLLRLSALSQIGEWAPENFAHPNALEAAMLGLIAVAATRRFHLAPLRLALLIGLIHLSLSHARHEMLLAVVAPMLLAAPLARAVNAGPEPTRFDRRVVAVALCAAAGALGVTRAFLPTPAPAAYLSTRAVLAALPPELKAKPVLNDYPFGGYLIFEGLKPYVDGRADLFGDAFLSEYSRIARGERDALDAALARENIGWTMFAPGQGAVAAMDATPGWRRVYADQRVVVHARD